MNKNKNGKEKNTARDGAFHIVVCVKQVPAGAQAKIDPVTKTLIRSSGASILNPYDTFAVEAALQIRDDLDARAAKKNGTDSPEQNADTRTQKTDGSTRITALSMGVPSVETLLKDLAARGVDDGVLLTDRAFAGADTIDTSYTLALGVREIEKQTGPVSLVICGHMAVDGDTAQIGPELAQTLDLPHVANVMRIEEVNPEEGFVIVSCIAAEGRQTLKVQLPALITVSKDINVPRLPSIAGIRRAEHIAVRKLGAEDVNADPDKIGLKGAATKVVRTFTPDFGNSAERITGNAASCAEQVRAVLGRIL